MPMKKFYYHSHGRTYAFEVQAEPGTLKYQLEVERALARSEQLMGTSREEAEARARVLSRWEDMQRKRGADKPKKGDGEAK